MDELLAVLVELLRHLACCRMCGELQFVASLLPVLTQIEILVTEWSVFKCFTLLGSAFCILEL